MKKHNRLKRNEDFDKLIREGKKVANDTYVIYYMPSLSTYNEFRVGISASKKLGNAVVRNKIKRQLRMMVDSLELLKYDYVIIVRNNYLKHNYHDNLKLLTNLNRRIK